jgi:hypothetical protein
LVSDRDDRYRRVPRKSFVAVPSLPAKLPRLDGTGTMGDLLPGNGRELPADADLYSLRGRVRT